VNCSDWFKAFVTWKERVKKPGPRDPLVTAAVFLIVGLWAGNGAVWAHRFDPIESQESDAPDRHALIEEDVPTIFIEAPG
jgi:hypothetical protein